MCGSLLLTTDLHSASETALFFSLRDDLSDRIEFSIRSDSTVFLVKIAKDLTLLSGNIKV